MSLRIVVLGHAPSARAGDVRAAAYRNVMSSLAGRGHSVLFLERGGVAAGDGPDQAGVTLGNLQFYDGLAGLDVWRPRLADADLVMLDADVPDGVAVARLAQAASGGVTALWDMDTPATLARLARGGDERFAPDVIPGFDLYLSSSGGLAPRALERRFGARRARTFYPSAEIPALSRDDGGEDAMIGPRWDLGTLGDYDAVLEPMLTRLLIEPARRMPRRRFVVAGRGWPDEYRWPANVDVIEPPADDERAEFASRLGWCLVLARPDEIDSGWSPGARLFEAAACGTPVISAPWRGLSPLFTPGRDIIVASQADDVIHALTRPAGFRMAIGRAGRTRVRTDHTPAHRASFLESEVAELLGIRRRRRVLVAV